jgi:hypothetical protein
MALHVPLQVTGAGLTSRFGPALSPRPRSRHGCGPQAAVRDVVETRRENNQFHRDECRRSEERFFFFESEAASLCSGGIGGWESFEFAPPDGSADAPVDASPPHPFGWGDAARVSREPLFSAEACRAVIDEAESSSAWRAASPIAAYAPNACTFTPLTALPRASAWLDTQLKTKLLAAAAGAFPHARLSAHELRCSAASLVKYNASAGQTRLGLHRDAPLLTGVVPLNSLGESQGGGTIIEALRRSSSPGHQGGVLRRPTGHLILHPSTLRHGGAPITSGVRYILVLWLFSCAHVPHAHYATQRAARILAAALRIRRDAGSAHRRELLVAAAEGFDEAVRLGAGAVTESAHAGVGQALIELGGEERRAVAALEEARRLAPINAHVEGLLQRARGGGVGAGVALVAEAGMAAGAVRRDVGVAATGECEGES